MLATQPRPAPNEDAASIAACGTSLSSIERGDGLSRRRPGHHPDGGIVGLLLLAGQSGFGERPASPREALLVPARELRHCDAVARRVDEPAVAEVDPRVVDLGRLRAGAGR